MTKRKPVHDLPERDQVRWGWSVLICAAILEGMLAFPISLFTNLGVWGLLISGLATLAFVFSGLVRWPATWIYRRLEKK